MIVHCDKCNSKFRLDDAKVKDAGVKVRCSKCRHIFWVYPATPKNGSEFDNMLRDLNPARAAVEPKKQDAEFSFTGSFAAPPQGKPAASLDDAMHEQQEPADNRIVPERTDFSFADFSSADEGVDRDTQEVAFSGDAYLQREELDFSTLLDEPRADAVDADRHGFEGLDVFDNFGFASAEGEPDADERAVSTYPATQEDEISQSGAALLTAESMAQVESDECHDAGSGAVVAELGDAFIEKVPDEEVEGERGIDIPGEEAAQGDQTGPTVQELPSLFLSSRRRQHSVLPLIVAVISVFFVLLLAIGGLLFMNGGPKLLEKMGLGFLPQLIGLQVEEEGNIPVRGITGAFLVNKGSGEIFVVTGEAVNGFKKPRAGIQVRALLHGPKGEIVGRRLAYCGNVLTVEQLKSLPMAKIESAMNNQFGDSLSNLGVAPGKAIPFVVVFAKVPENAVDYSVEIAGSTVAGK